MIWGVIMIIAGIISAIYGSSLNNDIEAQLYSALTDGRMNPGNIWLYGGIAILVIGIIIVVTRMRKNY